MRERFLEIYSVASAGAGTVTEVHKNGIVKASEPTTAIATDNFRVDITVNNGTPTVDVDVGVYDGTNFDSIAAITQMSATGTQLLVVSNAPGPGAAAIEVVVAGGTPDVDITVRRGYLI